MTISFGDFSEEGVLPSAPPAQNDYGHTLDSSGNTNASIISRFGKQVKTLRSRNTLLEACAIISGHVFSAVVVGFCSHALFHFGLWLALPAYFLAIYFIGSRYRALGNIVHECSHYAFTHDRNLNNTIGTLLCIPLFTSFAHYRRVHLTHHAHTGNYEKDLNFRDFRQFGFHKQINRAEILRHVVMTLTLQHLPKYIGRVLYVRTEIWPFNLVRLTYIASLALSILFFGPFSPSGLVIIGFIAVPYATTLQIITYWSDALDHAGLFDSDDPLLQTRNSVVENRLLRTLMFPRNDCYHLVHHLFPHIPIADLPICHAELMTDPAYAALHHSLVGRTMALWLRRPSN